MVKKGPDGLFSHELAPFVKVTRKRRNSPRLNAALKGEHLYYTGKPCKRGHVVERYTCSAMCVECSREWSREYARIIKGLVKKDLQPKD